MDSFDPQPVAPVPHKLRWYQYSMRSLLILMTLTAIVCTYWVYYRPVSATGNVTFQILLVKAAAFDSLLSGKTPLPVEGSPYALVTLDDQKLNSFLKDKQAILQIHDHTHTVHMWPNEADSFVCNSVRSLPIKKEVTLVKENNTIKNITNIFPAIDTDIVGGFLGFRRIGLTYKLRLDYDVSHMGIPDDELETIKNIPKPFRLSGKIFYEGSLPKGKLIFFARFSDDKYHVVVFDVKPVE
jgi:hypothetical protein